MNVASKPRAESNPFVSEHVPQFPDYKIFFFENMFTKSTKKIEIFMKMSHARGPERRRSKNNLGLKFGSGGTP